jgi:hypothetical protein
VPAAREWSGPDDSRHRWKRRVLPRAEAGEEKREGEGEEERREEKRKYKRLEHAIKIRGEIRSR